MSTKKYPRCEDDREKQGINQKARDLAEFAFQEAKKVATIAKGVGQISMGKFCNYSKLESKSHSVMSFSLRPHGSPWNSPGQNTGVGNLSLLQGIFPTQGLNHSLPHCKWILYQLSHRQVQEYWSGQPIPSPADLPNPGIEPGSPALQADSLPTELSGKPTVNLSVIKYFLVFLVPKEHMYRTQRVGLLPRYYRIPNVDASPPSLTKQNSQKTADLSARFHLFLSQGLYLH